MISIAASIVDSTCAFGISVCPATAETRSCLFTTVPLAPHRASTPLADAKVGSSHACCRGQLHGAELSPRFHSAKKETADLATGRPRHTMDAASQCVTTPPIWSSPGLRHRHFFLDPFDRVRLAGQRMLEHLVDRGDRDDLEALLHVVRDLGEILLVLLRDQHRLDAGRAAPPAASP